MYNKFAKIGYIFIPIVPIIPIIPFLFRYKYFLPAGGGESRWKFTFLNLAL